MHSNHVRQAKCRLDQPPPGRCIAIGSSPTCWRVTQSSDPQPAPWHRLWQPGLIAGQATASHVGMLHDRTTTLTSLLAKLVLTGRRCSSVRDAPIRWSPWRHATLFYDSVEPERIWLEVSTVLLVRLSSIPSARFQPSQTAGGCAGPTWSRSFALRRTWRTYTSSSAMTSRAGRRVTSLRQSPTFDPFLDGESASIARFAGCGVSKHVND